MDTSAFVNASICIKCGNLAVKGLCSDTVQGNMEKEEYFVNGTQPTASCDCHVKVTLCKESDMEPTMYCPLSFKETCVYLNAGTKDTIDAQSVLPESANSSCDVHTKLWDIFDSSETPEAEDQNENTDVENQGFFENLFGN